MLALWRGIATLLGPVLALRVAARRRAEGVAAARLGEFRGIASRVRPEGTLIWLHAASVGESLSLLPLIAALQAARPGVTCLVTTITATSAQMMAARLPDGAFHLFAPLDAPRYVRRFLRHWRPDLLVVVESELWPNLLHATDRAGIPRALVNARLSQRSLRRWSRMPCTARRLLAPFAIVSAQDGETARGLAGLGARDVQTAPDLKAAALPPPADADTLAGLRALIGPRPVWAAISTHDGEEPAILAAHDALRRTLRDALLILCPRHPARADTIAALAPMTRRSRGEGPEGAVWLVDTLGETGLWYRLAPVCFIGGSLGSVGGHNPWEGAQLGVALLHGPDVRNAAAAWAALDAAGGAVEVSRDALAATVAGLLGDAQRLRTMQTAARAAADRNAHSVAALAEALLALLPETAP
ncbi:MAG: hypothetical protein H3C51_10735 [Rubellimicrobium sp.]|nr:hypothetical protein [Rubellimicrobium sp.]